MGPVNRLPRELLLEILLYFAPRSSDASEFITSVQLSFVCRAWRVVIIDTPDFWIYPFLCIPATIDAPEVERRLQAIKTQLQRTGILKLHVTISISKVGYENTASLMESIRAFAPFHRWSSLLVKGTPNADEETLSRCGSFDNLKEISISSPVADNLISLIAKTAHQLEVLKMDNEASTTPELMALVGRVSSFFATSSRPLSFNLPHNITDLTLGHHRTLSSLPHTLPAVKRLNIDLLQPGLFDTARFPNVEHIKAGLGRGAGGIMQFPNLRLLEVIHSKKGSFKSIAAPRLEVLHLTGWHDLSDFATAVSDNTFGNNLSRVQLRHLQPTFLYLDIGVSPGSITTILAIYDRVTHLHLHFKTNWMSWDVIEEKLARKMDRDRDEPQKAWRYCPDLVSLRVTLGWPRREMDHWVIIADQISQARYGMSVVVDWSCGSKYQSIVNSI